MKTAHMGMRVSGAHFNALVEDLVGALDRFKVGEKGKNDLLGALGPMKSDLVEKPQHLGNINRTSARAARSAAGAHFIFW